MTDGMSLCQESFLSSIDSIEVYANYVSCATSPWDLTIMFARTVADNPDNPRLEQRASISLSPQTAKAMAHMLLRNLQSYEQQYGESGIPHYNPHRVSRLRILYSPRHQNHPLPLELGVEQSALMIETLKLVSSP